MSQMLLLIIIVLKPVKGFTQNEKIDIGFYFETAKRDNQPK
jgi:hypothetical protein